MLATPFSPIRLGAWDLPQRFVMAPLTRDRAGAGQVPTPLNAEYHAQRAGAGLLITEGTQPSAVGQGHLDTPGIHTADQVEGWRQVADAVHARGGQIIVNSGFGAVTSLDEVTDIRDLGDVVAVGREFLASPDLDVRRRAGSPLNEPNPKTFYGGGALGYTDYPTLA